MSIRQAAAPGKSDTWRLNMQPMLSVKVLSQPHLPHGFSKTFLKDTWESICPVLLLAFVSVPACPQTHVFVFPFKSL